MDGLRTLSDAEWGILEDGLPFLPEGIFDAPLGHVSPWNEDVRVENPPLLAGAGIKQGSLNDPQRMATWDPVIKKKFVELCQLRIADEKRGENSALIIKTIEKEFHMKLQANLVHKHRKYIQGLTAEQLDGFISRQSVKRIYKKLVDPSEIFSTKHQMEIFANGCEEWLEKHKEGLGTQRKVTSALQVDLAKEGLEVTASWLFAKRKTYCSSIEKINDFRDRIEVIFPAPLLEEPPRKRQRPPEETKRVYNHPHHSTSWDRRIKERFLEICREKDVEGKRGENMAKLQKMMEEEFGLIISAARIQSQRQHVLEHSDKELEVWLNRSPIRVPSSYKLEIKTPTGCPMTRRQMQVFADGCEERLGTSTVADKARITEKIRSSLAEVGLNVTKEWVINKIKYYSSRMELIDEVREAAGSS
ncbi:MAG: hypothetical protein KBC64_07975 [Simkaniaceae bacterium]|nr:hypothetical protein [Simkaniaceae bacterium]